ncbi:MAG: hypothetical protein AB7G44_06515 [Bacteroidia bacterium]
MKTALLLPIFFLLISNSSAQTFTDVKCATYIDYPGGLSAGYSRYASYTISKGSKEFDIKAKSAVGWDLNARVPYAKEEHAKQKQDSTLWFFSQFDPDRYYSVKEVYFVNGKDYTVYKHLDYNCYDILCGSMHGHMPVNTGTTWFSPDYGILIQQVHDREYDVIISMKEKEIPRDLVLAILKKAEAPAVVVERYKSDTLK